MYLLQNFNLYLWKRKVCNGFGEKLNDIIYATLDITKIISKFLNLNFLYNERE